MFIPCSYYLKDFGLHFLSSFTRPRRFSNHLQVTDTETTQDNGLLSDGDFTITHPDCQRQPLRCQVT